MNKISISEPRNPRASSDLLRELVLPPVSIMDQGGIREEHTTMEFDHSIVIYGWDGGQRPGCLQSDSKCLPHSDFCEKFSF